MTATPSARIAMESPEASDLSGEQAGAGAEGFECRGERVGGSLEGEAALLVSYGVACALAYTLSMDGARWRWRARRQCMGEGGTPAPLCAKPDSAIL